MACLARAAILACAWLVPGSAVRNAAPHEVQGSSPGGKALVDLAGMVAEAENKMEQVGQEVVDELKGAARQMVPAHASIQLGPSLEPAATPLKWTLALRHVPDPPAPNTCCSFRAELLAKDAKAAGDFKLGFDEALKELHLSNLTEVIAEGATVTFTKFRPLKISDNASALVESLMQEVGHISISEATDLDFQKMIAHRETPMAELLWSAVASADVSWTRGLEVGLLGRLEALEGKEDASPAEVSMARAAKLLLPSLSGFSADVRVSLDNATGDSLQGLVPRLNMSLSQVIEQCQAIGKATTPEVRATPTFKGRMRLATLAVTNLVEIKSVAAKGFSSDVEVIMTFENVAPFEFLRLCLEAVQRSA